MNPLFLFRTDITHGFRVVPGGIWVRSIRTGRMGKPIWCFIAARPRACIEVPCR